jgi:cobaltochelatase CobN
MAAWQVGVGLADDLILRYRREHNGEYPASVGISIWGTSAIRTAGDDIAQVMALLGVRPRWQAENRRIVGVEVIPLAELGRPRIDVVCRISGFFRDAFPHLISLLDQAYQAVMALDETSGMNYPLRHAQAMEARLLLDGKGAEEAAVEARYRVFGCAPGSYGAGILPLIDAGNWASDVDFADVYLTWGGYAYTANGHGVVARAAFANALSTVQVATKNQDNREHDIFDSDDYLQFHGGMVAAIRSLSATAPVAYLGDSSIPDQAHVDDLQREVRRIFRARVTNRRWLNAIQRHGYKGGLEMAATVDYIFGYDATASIGEDWMYQELAQKYVFDDASRRFLDRSNPWALREMTGRLIEAADRGMWKEPDEATVDQLKQVYLETEGLLEGGKSV